MRFLFATITLVFIAAPVLADTTMVDANTYKVDQGVAFSVSNSGSSHFLFSWSDGGGTFTNVQDPTLILVEGQTYTFARTTSSHPFHITDDSLPVSGSAGNYTRTTTDGAIIDTSTLQPIGEFTADPAPTSDFINWTPGSGEIGDYFYTCRVTFHTGMTGAIQVIAKAVPTGEQSLSGLKAGFSR